VPALPGGALDVVDTVGSAPRADRGDTNDLVSVTIAASGKITAKQPVDGKSVSFAANYFGWYDAEEDSFWATLILH